MSCRCDWLQAKEISEIIACNGCFSSFIIIKFISILAKYRFARKFLRGCHSKSTQRQRFIKVETFYYFFVEMKTGTGTRTEFSNVYRCLIRFLHVEGGVKVWLFAFWHLHLFRGYALCLCLCYVLYLVK